jgi:Aspartyl protease
MRPDPNFQNPNAGFRVIAGTDVRAPVPLKGGLRARQPQFSALSVCSLGLICFLSLAAADVTQLSQFQEKSQFFQLREALQRSGWNDSGYLFYRAFVESRFGKETAAIADFRKFLALPGDPVQQRKAYEELASALVRVGRYGEAAHALAQALRLTPPGDVDRAATENSRAIYESLADVAPQTVEIGEDVSTQASRNPLGSWDVPVEVNGRQGEWIFDTGANFSTLSESEAARIGLKPHETGTYVNGSTGRKNPLRFAVARDLRFGNGHLRNVIFLILADQALYISPLKYQIRGILGLPVLRALGCVSMSAKGELRVETKAAGGAGPPNLFLDGWELIADVRHGNQRLQMFLDTGANASFVYPSFRGSLTKDEIARLERKQDTIGGAGGTVNRMTEVAPTLLLGILGRSVEVKDISLLPDQPTGGKSYRDGVLGMDALHDGFTLDFRNMQLRLD